MPLNKWKSEKVDKFIKLRWIHIHPHKLLGAVWNLKENYFRCSIRRTFLKVESAGIRWTPMESHERMMKVMIADPYLLGALELSKFESPHMWPELCKGEMSQFIHNSHSCLSISCENVSHPLTQLLLNFYHFSVIP